MSQQIVCRRRAEETLFPFLKERGVRKFLLVCDAAFPHLRMAAPIASGPVPCAVFQGFSSNPQYEDVLRGVEAFRAAGCDAVVGRGGGSVPQGEGQNGRQSCQGRQKGLFHGSSSFLMQTICPCSSRVSKNTCRGEASPSRCRTFWSQRWSRPQAAR